MSETTSAQDTSESSAATANEQETLESQSSTDTSESGLSTDERSELEKLRAVHKDEQRWQKRAKQNFADAEKLRELVKVLGGEDNSDNFDPKVELSKLRGEIETSNTERLRADVARVKGVDPTYVVGKTEEEMVSAADRYLADIDARIKAALQGSTSPATESTSTVRSGDRVEGPKQITSEAELKKLSREQQMTAYKDGRLDKMLGRA